MLLTHTHVERGDWSKMIIKAIGMWSLQVSLEDPVSHSQTSCSKRILKGDSMGDYHGGYEGGY